MTRPLRVALYSGILVPHDAISTSLRLKLDLLGSWRAAGLPIETTAFVQYAEHDDPALVVGPTAAVVARHPAFRAADLHLFEFGIHYDLFDLVFLLPRRTRGLAVYHNVTPPELVGDDATRASVLRSLRQKANLTLLDHVACDSEFNRLDLLAFGLAADRLSVLHLPADGSARPLADRGRRRRGAPVELLYVGRFVRAKGVLDLLAAIRELAATDRPSFRVSFAGSQRFSDPEVVRAVQAAAASSPAVRFVGEADGPTLDRLLRDADVLVIPSYHEGYCLPVVEAYARGSQVTAYDAGNLPNVVGGLGLLVETGSVSGLAAALASQIDALDAVRAGGEATVPTTEGRLAAATWRRRVQDHLADYSSTAYERALRRLLADQASTIERVPPEVVEALRSA
jgi:glycosyltransferase involved in cell wall biosynthesis